MYKCILFIVATANIMFAFSAQVKEDAQARIVNYEFTNDGNGNYKFSYKSSNGLIRQETAEVVNAGQEDECIVIRGVYSYIDADGNIRKELYTVDETGYHRSALSATLPEPGFEDDLSEVVVASMLGR